MAHFLFNCNLHHYTAVAYKSKLNLRPNSRFWPYRPYLALFLPTKATWTSQNYAIIRIATLRSRNPTAPRNSKNRPREKAVFPQHHGNYIKVNSPQNTTIPTKQQH